MDIRPALESDLPELNELAFAAKAHWGYSREQLEAWRDDLTIGREDLRTRPVFVAMEGLAPAGFVQVATDTEPWAVEALWVHPSFMGRGFGKELLAFAQRFAARQGREELTIDADPNAEGFYLSRGAKRVGEVAAPIEGQPGRVRPQLRLATPPPTWSAKTVSPRSGPPAVRTSSPGCPRPGTPCCRRM